MCIRDDVNGNIVKHCHLFERGPRVCDVATETLRRHATDPSCEHDVLWSGNSCLRSAVATPQHVMFTTSQPLCYWLLLLLFGSVPPPDGARRAHVGVH